MCKKTNYKGTSNTSIDSCMRPLINWLKRRDYSTVACCCGHGKYPMTVVSRCSTSQVTEYFELFSNKQIPRSRRFYKKDSKGYYYIPEVSDEYK